MKSFLKMFLKEMRVLFLQMPNFQRNTFIINLNLIYVIPYEGKIDYS